MKLIRRNVTDAWVWLRFADDADPAKAKRVAATCVIPERRSLIRDRNRLSAWYFAIPARASLDRDDEVESKRRLQWHPLFLKAEMKALESQRAQ